MERTLHYFIISDLVSVTSKVMVFEDPTLKIDEILFCHATITPAEMAGGIYTLRAKAGEQVVPPTKLYTALQRRRARPSAN